MLGSDYREGYFLIIQIHRCLLLIFWFFTLKRAKTSTEYLLGSAKITDNNKSKIFSFIFMVIGSRQSYELRGKYLIS